MSSKLFRKLVASCLILVMVCTFATTVLGAYSEVDVIDTIPNEVVSERDGASFYFFDTAEYTFASQLSSLGFMEFSIYYKEANLAKTGIFDVSEAIYHNDKLFTNDTNERGIAEEMRIPISMMNVVDLSSMILSNLDDNVDDVIMEVITLKETETDPSVELSRSFDEQNNQHRGAVFGTLQSLGTAYFGAEYLNTLLVTRYFMGKNGMTTCQLKQCHLINYSFDSQWGVVISTALSLVVAVYGLPIDSFWDVVSWALTGAGLYQTAKGFTAQKYTVTNDNSKHAYIENTKWYWAASTQKYKAVSGDLGWTLTSTSAYYDSTHWDYNNNTLLLDTACNLYLAS